MVDVLLMPGAILGQFSFLLCRLKVLREKEKERRMGGKAQRRKRARERGQPKEKVGKKEKLVFFFVFNVCLPSRL